MNKFIVNTKELSTKLEQINKIVLNKNINDIWSGVCLSAKDNVLNIKGSNREMFFETELKAEVQGLGFKGVLNAYNLKQTLGLLKEYKKLELELDEKDCLIAITPLEGKNTAPLKASIKEPVILGKEVQKYEEASNGREFYGSIELDSKEFKKIIKKVSFSASMDETKNILNGVLLTKNEDNKLVFVSTDGHRMSIYTSSLEVKELNFKCIIPVKTFLFLESLLDEDDNIKISINNDFVNIKAVSLGFSITSRLTQGSYPNYQEIPPKSTSNKAIVSVKELQNIIKKVKVFTESRTKRIILGFNQDDLSVKGKNVLTKREATFSLNYEFEGTDTVVGLNYVYLSQFLNICENDKIEIRFNELGIIEFVDPKIEGYLHLIMPMNDI